jgi:hypothetical protein
LRSGWWRARLTPTSKLAAWPTGRAVTGRSRIVGEHGGLRPVWRPAAPWLKRLADQRLADQIGAIRDLAAKAPAAWSGEQVADAISRANKDDVEQILDSLAALLQPPGASSGSSGSSDGLDSWAFSSDGHTGRLGYPCRRPSDHARGDSPSETDSCRTVRTVRTVVPPVWSRVLADLRETLGRCATWHWPATHPGHKDRWVWGLTWALRTRRVVESPARFPDETAPIEAAHRAAILAHTMRM